MFSMLNTAAMLKKGFDERSICGRLHAASGWGERIVIEILRSTFDHSRIFCEEFVSKFFRRSTN